MLICFTTFACGISQKCIVIHRAKINPSFFKRFYLFRQRGREGERKEEKHQCVVASPTPLPGDLAGNPGTSPDGELNQ